MQRSALLAAMVLLVTGGCPGPSFERGDVADPQRVFYYAWSGTSPGAGFTFTSLCIFKFDLKVGRVRSLRQTATAPDPMLPHEEEKIAALVDAQPWRTLSPDEVQELRHLLLAWLKTAPPAIYDEPRNLGHEDGYVEQLTVYSEDGKRTTAVNPHAAFSPDGKGSPPPEWREFLAAAMACAFGQQIGEIQLRGL